MKYDESHEQQAFIRLASYRAYGDVPGGRLRDYMFAIPNAGTRGGRAAMLAGVRRKSEGVTAGVPDIEVFIQNRGYSGLHIEFKRADGVPSDVSDEQQKMMARLEACGRKCVVGWGCDDAWKKLCDYLGIKP